MRRLAMRVASLFLALGLSALAGCADGRYRLGSREELDVTPAIPRPGGGAGFGGVAGSGSSGSGTSGTAGGIDAAGSAGTGETSDGGSLPPGDAGGPGPLDADGNIVSDAGASIIYDEPAPGSSIIGRLVADEEHLYFDNWRAVWRIDHNGQNLEKLADGTISCLNADATHLYWSNDSGIRRVTKAGGSAELLLAGDFNGLLGCPGLTLDESYIFMATSRLTVGRLPKAGGAFEDIATAKDDFLGAGALTISQGALFWAEYAFVGVIYRTDLRTLTTAIFQESGAVRAHATGADLWFTPLRATEVYEQVLLRAPFDGGATTSYPVPDASLPLESDGIHLYRGRDNLMRINLSTGVQELIATVPHVSPRAIALTRAWIFVTDGTGIYRIAKPPP
jgi:hypothetical protein